MKKIMFVCHGNICRSPMAEFIMKDLVKREHLEESFYICSSATSTEELGNPVYPPARRELAKHSLSCDGKYSVQLEKDDYNKYDLLLCMDSNNVRNALRILGEDRENKVKKLMSFTGENKDVADPWYTGNFDITYKDIIKGCSALLEYLKEEL